MKISVDELEKVRNDYAKVGMEIERERIVSGLGACPCNCPTTGCQCGCGEEPEFTRNELLALINGEI